MININYDKNEFKRDYTRYVFYLRKTYLITIGSAAIISLGLFLFKDNFTGTFNSITSYFIVFTVGATAYTLYDLIKLLIGIPMAAKKLPSTTETLSFHPQRMELTHFGSPIVIFNRDLKGYKLIQGTLFLLSKSNTSWPVRLNPKEISPEGMKLLIDKLEQTGISKV
ncbi:MAG: hypothetical protein ACJAUD_001832 [Crocinitomicaceae bacterium]|jgi:hypothetical protein